MALTYSQKVTAILWNRSPQIADNATLSNALLLRLKNRGKIKKVGGGYELREPIYYQVGQNASWLGEWEQIPIDPFDHLTTAKYDWKFAASSMIISGQEKLQNSGKEQLIDLTDSKMQAAEDGITQLVQIGLYSDGTGIGGKQIGGLKHIIADTATTGIVGSINAADYTWWRNVSFDCTTDGGAALSASNVQDYLTQCYLDTTRGTDKVDLIVGDNDAWRYLHNSMTAIQRITGDSDVAKAGFMTLKFMGADVVADGGYGEATSGVASVSTKRFYGINTKYLRLVAHKDCFFAPLDPGTRSPVDQFGFVKLIGFYGNVTCNNRFLQFVIKD